MPNQHHLLVQHHVHHGAHHVSPGLSSSAHHQLNIPTQSQHQPQSTNPTIASASSTPKPSSSVVVGGQMSTIHSVNPLPVNTMTASPNSAMANSTSGQATSSAAGPGQSSVVQAANNPLQELLSLFECPVCFEFALPPIMQCQSGHIVCSNCRPKLTCCPTCRSALGNIRNLSMEKIAYSLKFPCKYTSYGCSESMSHETKLEHEDVCEFRMYNCPCPGASCKWQVMTL